MEQNLYKRLQLLQAELKAPKNRVNKFGGYKYRNTEDILQGVKPLLKKHNLALTISDEVVPLGAGESVRFYVKTTVTIYDVEDPKSSISNSAYAREPEAKKGMDDSQITGTASSYARKYALGGLLCIDDGIDADNDEVLENLADLNAEVQCECCGKMIKPFNDGKRAYNPMQIVRASQIAFGKDLCWLCAKNAKAEHELAARESQKKGK